MPENLVVQFMVEIPSYHRYIKKLSFVENEGYDGGPVTLDGGSSIYKQSITLVRNRAHHCGGAMYCLDDYHEGLCRLEQVLHYTD